MKRVLLIGVNDLRLFLKHRSSWIWLFVMPLAFVYIMGFLSRPPDQARNHQAPLVIDNQDSNHLARIFLDELQSQGMWLLDPTNRDTAARVLVIPADFTSRLLSGEPARVRFRKRSDSGESDTALTELRVLRAMIAMNGHLLEAAGGDTNRPDWSEAHLKSVLALPDPVRLDSKYAGRKPVPTGFNFSLPGNLVMYLMMNLLLFGGMNIAMERGNGVLRRFMVCPVSRFQLVMGKICGLMLLGLVQVLVFMVMGRFVFHMSLGANLPAVFIVLLVFCWVAGSLGVLAGSLLSAADRIAGVCILASIAMAALGGCWWPLEIVPAGVRAAALCTPTGWALAALHQLISFGNGFESVLLPLAVLAGFGAAANSLAAKFFRA
ncbi:MAG: ABC transporter permease [Verrucomicrobiota bacterium]